MTGTVPSRAIVIATPTVQVKLAVPDEPVPSVTVTVTADCPVLAGVPEMSPVAALIARPAGRPVAA